MKKLRQNIWFPDPINKNDEIQTSWSIGELKTPGKKVINHFHFYKKENEKEKHVVKPVVYTKLKFGCTLCGKVPADIYKFQIDLLRNNLSYHLDKYLYIISKNIRSGYFFRISADKIKVSSNNRFYNYYFSTDHFNRTSIRYLNRESNPVKLGGQLDKDLRTFKFFLEYYNRL